MKTGPQDPARDDLQFAVTSADERLRGYDRAIAEDALIDQKQKAGAKAKSGKGAAKRERARKAATT